MRPFLLILGWALVALIIYLSLTPHPPSIHVAQGDKLGHAFGYPTTMFWFAQLYLLDPDRNVVEINAAPR